MIDWQDLQRYSPTSGVLSPIPENEVTYNVYAAIEDVIGVQSMCAIQRYESEIVATGLKDSRF